MTLIDSNKIAHPIALHRIPTYNDIFKQIPTYIRIRKPIPTHSDRFRTIPEQFRIRKLVPTDSSHFRIPIPTHSDRFKSMSGAIPDPETHTDLFHQTPTNLNTYLPIPTMSEKIQHTLRPIPSHSDMFRPSLVLLQILYSAMPLYFSDTLAADGYTKIRGLFLSVCKRVTPKSDWLLDAIFWLLSMTLLAIHFAVKDGLVV